MSTLIILSMMHSTHQSRNNCLNIKFLKMWVFLANPNEDNRFASGVNHVQSSPNLFINGVKLGKYNAVNGSWIRILNCVVN